MTDYTPGSWFTDLDWYDERLGIKSYYIRAGADGVEVAVVNDFAERADANAALIAAAPEMYEALAAILRYISSHQIYDKDARGLIERTLAKARGES